MELLPRNEDVLLAEIWLAHFGSPMPIYGAPAVARRILLDHGARDALRQADLQKEDGETITPAIRPLRRRVE
ncbi:hypothetical protein D3C86_1732890 [compost metagenome]|jgi:hypothetical protein